MDKTFFGQQIERLRNVYPHGMNEERAKILWDKFRDVDNEAFQRAMTYLISENTSQTLPSISKFNEAMGYFRSDRQSAIEPYRFQCEACKDAGWDFIGPTVTACVCARGREMSPEKLARYQRDYDKGRALWPSPFDRARGERGPTPRLEQFFPDLPYDPRERIE